MTPEQAAQRVRQLAFQLHKADYGMGMPRDYQRVLELRVMLDDAIKKLASPDDNADEDAHFGQCDCCGKTRALARTWMYGRMETWACVECTGGDEPEPIEAEETQS